jgi:uncharacterized membrane protein
MKKQVLAVVCGLFLAVGVAGAQVYVRIGPPPPHHEVVPPPPHPGWIWQPGYQRWNGSAYEWVPGTYVEAPHVGATWVAGHWAHRHGGWVWIEGHWA